MPKKVHFIVEGQTEAVFVRHMLELLHPGKIKIVVVSLRKDFNLGGHQKVRGIECVAPDYDVTVVDAAGEGGIIPAAEAHGQGFLAKGSESILCLRDMYCEEYAKATGSKVVDRTTQEFIDKYNKTMTTIDSSGKTRLFFSIMEIEAWFLAMESTLQKIESSFTPTLVKDKAGVPAADNINVERIYKPSKVLSKLYESAGKKYTKSVSCAESVVSKINKPDIDKVISENCSESFSGFHEAVVAL